MDLVTRRELTAPRRPLADLEEESQARFPERLNTRLLTLLTELLPELDTPLLS